MSVFTNKRVCMFKRIVTTLTTVAISTSIAFCGPEQVTAKQTAHNQYSEIAQAIADCKPGALNKATNQAASIATKLGHFGINVLEEGGLLFSSCILGIAIVCLLDPKNQTILHVILSHQRPEEVAPEFTNEQAQKQIIKGTLEAMVSVMIAYILLKIITKYLLSPKKEAPAKQNPSITILEPFMSKWSFLRNHAPSDLQAILDPVYVNYIAQGKLLITEEEAKKVLESALALCLQKGAIV
jgi:hypothetical protein